MATNKKAAANLESVTDYVEEKTLDQDKTNAAMARMRISEKKSGDDDREKKLAAVKVNKDDIEVLKKEFGLDDKESESILRNNEGDLQQALTALVRS